MYDFTNVFQWIKENISFSSSTGDLSQYEVTVILLRSTESKMTIGNFHPDDAASIRCIKN